MAISIDSQYMALNNAINSSSAVNAEKLSNSIGNVSAETSDEELLDACKGFEQYFVEQVMKEFTKSLDLFENNTYMDYFGDTLIQEYAKNVTENGNLGIANMMYESMKARYNDINL